MKKLLPFLALLILFAWGCGKSEKKEETTQKEDKVVARVNGKPIYEKDMIGKMSLEDAIDDEILYEEGLKRGLNKRFENLKLDESRKRAQVISRLKFEIMNSLPIEISDKEIEDYYKENKSKYTLPHVEEIVLGEDKNLAEEIHKKALTGEDFEKIASDYSKSGTNVIVRDLGFSRNYNDLFSGKGIGSVSDVIQVRNQFRILKVIELKEAPLSEVKNTVRDTVLAEKKEEAFREFVKKSKKENKVEIVEEKK